MNNLATLPVEIVKLIVGHVDQRDLYSCTRINTLFYGAANPLLWRSVNLTEVSRGLGFLYSLVMAKHPVGSWIRHVHLQDFHWKDRSLMALLKRAPHLQSLVVDNATRITDTSIQHLARYCPRMQLLHLTGSPITDVSYRVLGEQCPQLTHLELWCCRGLQPDTFSTYFATSPLEKLELALWVDEKEQQLGMVDPWLVDETTVDLTRLQRLTHLKVIGGPFGMLQQAIDHRPGLDFCWPHLTQLELEGLFDMTNDDMLHLLRGLPIHLTHLVLKDGQFTNVTLDAVATYQPSIVALDVSANDQLTPAGIRSLVRRCPPLVSMVLEYCGMMMADFPEADAECAASVVLFDRTILGLHHLDQQAMEAIRRGPLPPPLVDQEDADADD